MEGWLVDGQAIRACTKVESDMSSTLSALSRD